MRLSSKGIAKVVSTTVAASVIAAGGVAVVTPVLTGCTSSSPFDKDAAATFNGGKITEKEVDDYITDYKKAHSINGKKAWKDYLKQSGSTEKSMRTTAINTLESRKVIENDAKNHGIEITNKDIDGKIKELQKYYGYDNDEWKEQLKTLGYTNSGYRAYIKDSLLREKLMQKVITNVKVKDSDVIKLANDYTKSLNGAKKLSVITFDDEKNAEKCETEIKSGSKTFDEEKKTNGGDNNYDGWDCIVTEDDAVKNAIKNMKKGDISDVIAGENLSFIVQVNEEVNVPDGGFSDKSQITDELYDEFKSSVESNDKYSQFNDYVDDLMEKANLKVK